MTNRTLAGLVAATFILGFARGASAATVSVEGSGASKVVAYHAAPGETNQVGVFGFDSGAIEFSETIYGVPLTAGAGCVQGGANWVTCDPAGAGSITLDLGDGSDQVEVAGNTLPPIVASGGPGDDRFLSAREADDFSGGPGNDTFVDSSWELGGGGDRFSGGDGFDTADYSDWRGSVSITLDNVANDGVAGENDNVASDVEHLVGGPRDDTIVGTDAAELIQAGGGSDHIDAGGGDDVIDGGADDCSPDTISAGPGNDTIDGEGGGDTIDGGPGNDTIRGHRGCEPDGDSISGGSGTDTVDYADGYDGVTVTLDGVADDGTGGEDDNVMPDVENVSGGPGSDVLVGNSSANVLDGRGGDDLLAGGGGNDTLHGSVGSDVLNGGGGADLLDGGADEDVADYSDRTAPLVVDLDGQAGDDGAVGEGDTVQSNVEDIWGGAGDDRLTGNDEDNILDGGPGADRLVGLGGEDVADYSLRVARVDVTLDDNANDGEAGEGDDVASDIEDIVGGAGDDRLVGDASDNLFDGGPGADEIVGGAGVDAVDYSARTAPVIANLNGSPGDDGEAGERDTIAADVEGLVGGAGNDVLVGNAGNGFLFGGDGDDQLSDPGGADVIDGGPGDDLLRSRDGSVDADFCGDGTDAVTRDATDGVDPDCESVDPPVGTNAGANPPPAHRPSAPVRVPSPLGTLDRTPPRLLELKPRFHSLTKALRRGGPVSVGCDEICSIRATLSVAGSHQLGRARGGAIVARGSLGYGSPGTRELRLTFTRGARRSLHGVVGGRFRLTLVVRDRAGNTSRRTSSIKLGTRA